MFDIRWTQVGKLRQTVLEVVHYETDTGACIVVSGFGGRDSHIIFTIGKERHVGLAVRFEPEAAGYEFVGYTRHYPLA
jgi:hypothetical protein